MTDKKSIRLPERFDFSFHKTFNNAYESVLTDNSTKELELDFSLVQYLDSSALGMLVLLAKKISGTQVSLSIAGAQGAAKDIIEMANLSKLYTIK